MNPTSVIGLEKVFFQYKLEDDSYLPVLEDIDLSVKEGEFVSIVGSSGSGKTTLLKLISGLLEPTSGTIQLWNEPADKLREKGKMGFVFQTPLLLPWRNTEENIRLPLELGQIKEEDSGAVKRALEITKLIGRERFYPNALSGGMQTRANLARALVLNPQLILLDEPFAHLDEITRLQLQQDLSAIWRELRTTIIFVTHSISEAVLLSDRIYVIGGKPSRTLKPLEVDVPRPRWEKEGLPEFMRQVHEIREMLMATS